MDTPLSPGITSPVSEHERKHVMKYLNTIAAAALGAGLAGCASPTQLTVHQPRGPSPTARADASDESALQVYSARERAPIDLNLEEYRANDFGKNDGLFETAHTGYSIYAPGGSLVQKVKNARDISDATPARVTLPPGQYTIKADAELPDGETFTVNLPVVIEPGKTTTVHLEPDWKPAGKPANADSLVRVYDGRILGWRAEDRAELANHAQAGR